MGPAELFARFFSVGLDILSTTVNPTTGVITVQLGDSTRSQAESDTAEMWGPAGLAATPLPPTSGNSSCQAIALRRSDYDLVLVTRDTRNAAINKDLDAGGESALYTAAGADDNGRVVCRKDGSVETLSTTQIRLGSKTPGDAVALASKVDANFANILSAAQAGLSAAVPNDGGTAAFTAFIAALSSPPTASQLVKVAS